MSAINTTKPKISLAKCINHAVLAPTSTDLDLKEGFKTALRYGVKSICVLPSEVKKAVAVLSRTGIDVCTVVGYPFGGSTVHAKLEEAKEAINLGAKEVEFVINVGRVLSLDWPYIQHEIKVLNRLIVQNGATAKAVLGTHHLAYEHIALLCRICSDHKVAFVKNTVENHPEHLSETERLVQYMRNRLAIDVQIETSAQVHTPEDIQSLNDCGATRICTSDTAKLLSTSHKDYIYGY